MDTGLTVITPNGYGMTYKFHPVKNIDRIAVRLFSGETYYYFISELKFC